MLDGRIQPERDYLHQRSNNMPGGLTGRAWVKRDLEFWHRCTVEGYDRDSVTVVLDNLDELTVPHDHVQSLELEPGDLVFVKLWPGSIYGNPAIILGVNDEAAEVEYPNTLYDKRERHRVFLRDIQFYHDIEEPQWRKGDHVFSYRNVRFTPELFLLFPGVVQEVQFEVLVRVEFNYSQSAIMPATLVQQPELNVGDIVYTCTTYVSHAINPHESWSPCRIVDRRGDTLTLQDGSGDRFEAPRSMVAVLPKGYQMFDGKFERIPSNADAFRPTESLSVHVIRTDHWSSAATDPITREHVNALLASDPALTWSSGDRIAWRGEPCFWWNRHEIRCDRPTEKQLAKLIEIAIELDANVVGDDGREYH